MSAIQRGNHSTPKPGGRHLLLALIVLQIACVVPTLAARIRDGDDRRGGLLRLETGLPSGTVLTIETGWEGAIIYAKQWAADAYLFGASMHIEWPTDPTSAASSNVPATGWLIYTFGSSRHETMSILVDRRSGAVFDEQHMKWSGKPNREIVRATYPISSTTALFATETTLGAPFRQACPIFRSLSRVSFVPGEIGEDLIGEQKSYWLVSYEDSRSLGRPAFTVRVDVENGSVHRDDIAIDEITKCES